MLRMKNLRTYFRGFTGTVTRFHITILFLFAAAVWNAVMIVTEASDPVLLCTFYIGAAVFAVLQMICEYYSHNKAFRLFSAALSLIAAFSYYLIYRNQELTTEPSIKTMVFLFLLGILFLWIPSIGSETEFNESFMAAFKAFFMAVFFSGILFLGTALVLAAIDMLIVPISSSSYAHAANIIFILYAPLYFLSLIPEYQGGKTMEKSRADGDDSSGNKFAAEAGNAPKFLVSLLSYVIIPVTALFTIILLIYILINITDEFWTDSLLEPLLVTYSITVIIVYLLVSRLVNPIADGFRRIFPKILVPVVLFQTLSSLLRIGNEGITYGRYYVIIFGIFATAAGLLFCFVPVEKNGLIAPVLIILSLVSILPPVDAFTVSRSSQSGRLKSVLTRNHMLSGNVITPNPNLSEEDRRILSAAVAYLDRMAYSEDFDWLATYRKSYNFNETFGFYKDGLISKDYQSLYLYLEPEAVIDISGYDFFRETSIYENGMNRRVGAFRMEDRSFTLRYESKERENAYLLLEEDGKELLRLPVNDVYHRFGSGVQGSRSAEITPEEARFTAENEEAVLTLIARTININNWQEGRELQAEAYILVKIK